MKTINVYSYDSDAYHKAFAFFLEHTDEKVKTRQSLEHLVAGLPRRRTFVDAGAGEGGTTSWIAESFEKTIAIEPNSSLRSVLQRNCPGVEILPNTIVNAPIEPAWADFVLCAHVFYYIEDSQWEAHLEKLASWLSGNGVLVLAMQHHLSDCMKLHSHFCGRGFDLTPLTNSWKARHADCYEVHHHVIPIQITVKDMQSAIILAEFMLNLLPLRNPPSYEAVETYIEKHFSQENGGYRFSSDQVLVQIHRKS